MRAGTFREKIGVLCECGFCLSEPFTIEDLAASWDADTLQAPGFDRALASLGASQERPPWTPHCRNLWHFDAECIEGDGSYVRIARRMAEMTQGSLVLTNLEDRVDLDEGVAWLEFDCGGQRVHVDCTIDDDWVDQNVFGVFVTLLARHAPDKLFIYYDLHGQDCILGCTTRKQFELLRREIPEMQPLE